ncbi:MAG: hypothetical protein MN733_27375, partial [Nitrososphaera sp.]|nr:hypothetical protein [Nitrososphaera sp.]
MQNTPCEVRFSSHVYTLETIKRAAYRFTGQLVFNFIPENDFIVCEIKPVSTKAASFDAADAEIAINEFKNEVLDQDLRRT